MRNSIASMVVLATAWVFAGTAAAAPMKIGVVIPISGLNASAGEKIRSGYQQAEYEINRSGGINGEPVQFVFADHQGKPDVGAREAERLVDQEKVVALTGAFESGVTLTVAQVAERRRIPFVVPYSAANRITESGLKYTFRTRPPSRVWVDTMYKFTEVMAKLSGKPIMRVGMLTEDGAYGQSMVDDIKTLAARNGKQLVASETFKSGAQDLTAPLTKLKAANVDVILAASYLNDSMKVFQTMNLLQFRRPYMTIGSAQVDAGFFQLGPLADGAVGTAAWMPDLTIKGTAEFIARFRERSKLDITDDTAYAYAAAYLFKEAAEVKKSTAPEAVREVLATHTFTSERANLIPRAGGASLKFDDKGQANTIILVAQAQGGKWLTVWPEGVGSQPPKLGQWVPGNR